MTPEAREQEKVANRLRKAEFHRKMALGAKEQANDKKY